MDQRSNIIINTVKLLEENIGVNLSNLEVESDLLHVIKAYARKEK